MKLVVYLLAFLNLGIGLVLYYRKPSVFRGMTYESYNEKDSDLPM